MDAIKTMWTRVSLVGTGTLKDYDPQRIIAIWVNKMSLIVALINATAGLVSCVFTRSFPLLAGVALEIALMSLPIILNYYSRYNKAGMTLYIIVSAATCYFCCILGKLVEVQLAIAYLVGASMFFFLDKRSRIICIGIAVLTLIIVEANFRWQFITPLKGNDNVRYFLRWAAYIVIMSLVIFTFELFRKNNEDLLLKSRQHAKEVEDDLKLEEQENKIKDKFISNATHEMRVSFYSIFSIISIIYKQEQDPERKKGIEDLKAACKYSKSIIDNILEYERYKAGLDIAVLDQLIDIRMLLKGIVDIYKYLAEEKKVKIEYLVSEDLSQHIISDEVKLRQIITNLLHNAIKFTRIESTIKIVVEHAGDTFILSVVDEGEGIQTENIDFIFQPFFTKNPEGLGLGLYIVKELVDALKGKIEIVDNSAEGVKFSIDLPLLTKVKHTSEVLSMS